MIEYAYDIKNDRAIGKSFSSGPFCLFLDVRSFLRRRILVHHVTIIGLVEFISIFWPFSSSRAHENDSNTLLQSQILHKVNPEEISDLVALCYCFSAMM